MLINDHTKIHTISPVRKKVCIISLVVEFNVCGIYANNSLQIEE